MTITEAPERLGVSQGGLSQHLAKHPEDYDRHGIRRRTNIPSLLENYGKGAFRGRNIREVAEEIGVPASSLRNHFQNHPDQLTFFGIKKGQRSELRSVPENERAVVNLFESGLERKSEAFAMHGTSLEAIQHLIETGVMPAEGRLPGEFYFLSLERHGVTEAMKGAVAYAQWNANKHYISDRLPFELNKALFEGLSQFVADTAIAQGQSEHFDQFLDAALQHEISRKQLTAWLMESIKNRGGVVILIDPRAEQDFKTHYDDDPNMDGDYLRAPEGLPLEYIIGIEPQGDYEYEFLEALQAEVESRSELRMALPDNVPEEVNYARAAQETRALFSEDPNALAAVAHKLMPSTLSVEGPLGIAFDWHVAFNEALLPVAAEMARTGTPVGVIYTTRSELRLIEDINQTLDPKNQLLYATAPRELALALRTRGAAHTTYVTAHEVTAALLTQFYDEVVVLQESALQELKNGVAGLADVLNRAVKAWSIIAQKA